MKYYGSYFKNTDLWIVMEYCGAGSVSDIIRLRNKTVGAYRELQLWCVCTRVYTSVIYFTYISVKYLCYTGIHLFLHLRVCVFFVLYHIS